VGEWEGGYVAPKLRGMLVGAAVACATTPGGSATGDGAIDGAEVLMPVHDAAKTAHSGNGLERMRQIFVMPHVCVP
jgi:hypothetical protein